MNIHRLFLALSVALSGVCGAGVSFAQQSVGSESIPSAAEGQLEEITVTAERRSERLQDVPIAVSVLTADEARKMGNNDNLSLFTQVPSLNTSRQLTGATIYLRGVGTSSAPGNENAVATYIDDVYINGFSGTVVPFNTIDHVEVLNGPQGTLFGRNATGGVIHIVTKDPSTNPSMDVRAGYASYNTFSGSLYGTTGIGPNLAVDIALNARDQRNGYGHDLATGQPIYLGSEYGVRSKLKWTPGESTAVTLALEHYWDDYDYSLNPNVPRGTLSAGGATFAGDYNSQGSNAFQGGASGHTRHVDGVTLTAEHQFGWATLKSVSAARRITDVTGYDQDMGPAHISDLQWPSKLEQYTEELHLSSPEGTTLGGHGLHWLAGLYVLKMSDALLPLQIAGSIGALSSLGIASISDTHSYAAFFDTTYDFTPATSLTLGIRETADRIKNTGYTDLGFPGGTHAILPAPEQHANASKPTFRAVLDHKFTRDLMAYGSISRGFKSGGFALFAGGSAPVQPETLDAYALGLKSEWLEHHLQVNLEAYHYNYKNQQVEVFIANGAAEVNAAASRMSGADLSVVAVPSANLTLRGNFGYLHSRYESFPAAPVYLQNPATCAPTPTRLPGPLTGGDLLCSIDAAGLQTVRSPTFTGNVSGDYVIRTSGGDVDLVASYFRTSSFSWDPSGQYPEPAYGLLDTSVTWTAPSNKYDVQLWCKNCTDKYHDAFISEAALAIQRAASDPRTFGIQFGAHF